MSSDRDFLLEFVFDLSLIALHLSGWAEEWVIWATTEFSFLDLPDAFCTGSSIMPHKKNPDVLELIRGKTARVVADLQQLMMLVKGLPLAYNRDLQEDKDRAVRRLRHRGRLAGTGGGADPARRVCGARSLPPGSKTAFWTRRRLMELLIARGMPMRAAHEAIGRLVRLCEERRCRLSDLAGDDYEKTSPGLSADVYKVLGVEQALRSFRSFGSTAPAEVARQLDIWKQKLGWSK